MSKTRTARPDPASADPPTDEARRALPSVDRVLEQVGSLIEVYGRDAVRDAVRALVDECRQAGRAFPAAADAVSARVESALVDRFGPPLSRVINATGVLVHTNLGRAPLPRWVSAAIAPLVDAYCDLEFDLATGKRGDRNLRVEALLTALTGAESALVVNNNAAAVFLALATLAAGREVLLSRGEMVEIGGSFRIPEILEASGAKLVEVGTTNRTRIDDFRAAVSAGTGALLKVNPSNFRIEGFTHSASTEELVALAREHDLRVIADEGSGLLRRSDRPQLSDHESLAELVAAGVDVACGSGDKVLGGPQAGILVGTAEVIERLRRAPLYRALRPSRLTLLGLRMVLEGHLRGAELPLDRLWADDDDLLPRLERLRDKVGGEIVEREAYVGGGSAAQRGIPGPVVALDAGESLQAALRQGDRPVVTYIKDGKLHIDLRTVDPADDDAVLQTLSVVMRL